MKAKLLLTCAALIGLAGCTTPPTAYVTHQFATIEPQQIVAAQEPLRLQVVTRRYRGEELYNDASPWVYTGAVAALKKTGVIQPSPQGEDGKVLVVVKEVDSTAGDTARGIAHGVLGGLTLGAIGFTAKGEYDVSLQITTKDKVVAHPPVRVDVNIRFGSDSAPPGLQTYRDNNDALKQALSDAILWTVWDMQKQGLMPLQ
ncbi:hypothetical protein [uncultured Aquabacterium sp.]|uniref:hypothetical protein n=1 Tax=uncultured Aquabacterium sp. TaxID=158753 RepID=UPI0026072360|nr:hypothetical protein [uncultured Aquabacterium sp.]